MKALYRKELRGLLPLLVLMAALFGSDFLYRPLTERLDEISWVEQSGHLEAGEGRFYAGMLMIMALIAAYSVFPREHDEKTIELLYALPITRRGIFFAKALAAWTVLVSGIVLDQAAGAALQALNPETFSGGQWRLGLAARIVFLDSFFAAVILLHGLAVSFLRRFGLLVYAAAALAVSLIKKLAPGHAYLDPNELLELEFHGSELVLPWSHLAFHGAVALAVGALAYVLWMGYGERVTPFYARIQSHLAGRFALGCVSATLALGATAWMVTLALEEETATDGAEPVRYRPFLPVRAATEHYDFTYAASSTEAARELLREADRVYAEVAGFLGAEPGLRIDADLTDEGSAHLGIAQGGVIRLALPTLSHREALVTLYHETAHAFQFHLAGRRVAEHMRSLRLFVEGSAMFVASELAQDGEARRAHRRLAAAAWDRHRIRFEELFDDDAFTAAHDTHLVYALGETWAAALAEACGARIVGGFFRALARDDAPEDLDGLTLWQDTLQAAGCALEKAAARWGAEMKTRVEAERDFLAGLPRLGGGLARVEDGELVFHLQLDRAVEEPAETYFLRLRRDADAPEDQVYTFTAALEADGSGAVFRVPEGWLESDAFEIQLGQSIAGSLWPFYEDWQAVSYTP